MVKGSEIGGSGGSLSPQGRGWELGAEWLGLIL